MDFNHYLLLLTPGFSLLCGLRDLTTALLATQNAPLPVLNVRQGLGT